MSELHKFIRLLQERGLEHFRVFYGVYRGIVRDTSDPENRGRIQVEVKPFNDSEESMNVWIDPVYPGAGPDRGSYWPAELGDTCRVMFESGQPSRPYLALPGWYGEDQRPSEFSGTDKKGFVTRMGHRLVFSDTDGAESIRLQWFKADSNDAAKTDESVSADRRASGGQTAVLHFEPDGSIQLINAAGSTINMQPDSGVVIIEENGNWLKMDEDGVTVTDNQGNWIQMADGSVNIKSDGNVNINAKTFNAITAGSNLSKNAVKSGMHYEDWVAWAATHTHNTGVGPTTPPQVPPPLNIKSNKVKL